MFLPLLWPPGQRFAGGGRRVLFNAAVSISPERLIRTRFLASPCLRPSAPRRGSLHCPLSLKRWHLTRSSLRQCFQRYEINPLPETESDKPAQEKFKSRLRRGLRHKEDVCRLAIAAKDRHDVKTLLRTLIAWCRGERHVWSLVRIPSIDEEDLRRSHRERSRPVRERTAHINRNVPASLSSSSWKWPVQLIGCNRCSVRTESATIADYRGLVPKTRGSW